MIWVALTYLLVGTVALWPSIRPGRTLVPADDLVITTPYSTLPGAARPRNLLLSDATYQFYPWFSFVAAGLRRGEIRQWNPTLLAGVPVSPNGNVSPYYPPTWLAAVLAPFDAYNLFVLLHLVLGALGVYVLARALGASPLPSWVAGLLAFTAAFWVHWSTHLVHLAGMVWVPWIMAAVWWLVAAPSRRRAAALAGVVGLWLSGGSPQYLFYGGLALAGWALAALAGRRSDGLAEVVQAGVALAAAVVLGAGLAAAVLLPTAAAGGQVARSRETQPPTAHIPLAEAIRALVPDATGNPADQVAHGSNDELRMDSPFVGATTVLLAGAALAGVRRRAGMARLALVAGAVVVLGLAFTAWPHRVLYAVVPGYDRFRASPRWLFLLPAFALPLAAMGLQDLLTGLRRARIGLLVAASLSVAAVGGWLVYEQGHRGSPTTYFVPRALLAVAIVAMVSGAGWLARPRPRPAAALIAAAALVEIAFNTPRWYPRVRERDAYPGVAVADVARARGGRIIRVGTETPFPPFAPDLPTQYGVADAQGLSVFFPEDYDRFLRLVDDYGLYARELNIAPPLRDGRLLASKLLDVLDVRTVVAAGDVPIPTGYPALSPPGAEPSVYARPSPGGALVVAVAEPVTEAAMWARVAAPGWDPAGSAAVMGLDGPVIGSGGTVRPLPAAPDRERWDADSPSGGFLRVGANGAEGWSARVDGRAVPVLRADGVFRGVVLAPGRHLVEFSYRNLAESRGRTVAVAAGVLLAALLAPHRRYRGRRRSGAMVRTGAGAETGPTREREP